MKKILFIMMLGQLALCAKAQTIYSCTNGEITFFSKAPIEDIDATSKNMNSVFNTGTGELLFIVPIRSFNFNTGVIQEHFNKKKEEFNDKYMESDKFPSAKFKGKIQDTIDYSKDGEYNVSTTGTLTIHGVDQPRTERGKLTIKDGIISITGEFNVALKDHHVEIPKLLTQNIAEVVDIKFTASYAPYKKE